VRVLSTSVHGLEMPVGECPCSARGTCPFLCPWSALCFCLLHICTCTTNLYYSESIEFACDNHILKSKKVSSPAIASWFQCSVFVECYRKN
jgi:hypothetical protein